MFLLTMFKCEYVEVFFLNIPCLYFMTFGSEMTENNAKRLPVSLVSLKTQ